MTAAFYILIGGISLIVDTIIIAVTGEERHPRRDCSDYQRREP